MSNIGSHFSLGLPYELYSSIEKGLDLQNPNQNRILDILNRAIATGVFSVMPLCANNYIIEKIPPYRFLDLSMPNRMFMCQIYNGVRGIVQALSAGCYAIRGERLQTRDHLRKTFRYAWRFGLDFMLLSYLMALQGNNVKIIIIVEGILNAIFPRSLRHLYYSFSRLLDSLFGKTSKETIEERSGNVKIKEKTLKKPQKRYEKKSKLLNRTKEVKLTGGKKIIRNNNGYNNKKFVRV